ncbi:cuticle protein 7 [Eupeodes corollae]|uniref:cuticle protein 7 n=1 Tax=Eupeodes corollae TaxID=290404 RepID=UPI0024919250|nr:cuticle protein 7 [Eupeodes corollae]
MSLKFVLLISVVAAVAAIEIQQPYYLKNHEIEEGPAEYEFAYSVSDKHTGDIKAQKEVRKGDRVEGVYELIEPDGHRRIVQYRSDKHTGFEAVVHREPTGIKIPIPEQRHKLIATKIYQPLVHHQAIAPLHGLNLIRSDDHRSIELGRSEGIEGNHVSYSGPGISYSY